MGPAKSNKKVIIAYRNIASDVLQPLYVRKFFEGVVSYADKISRTSAALTFYVLSIISIKYIKMVPNF